MGQSKTSDILNQLRLARAALKDDYGAHCTDDEPSRQPPPGDLQDRANRVVEARAGKFERLVGDNIGMQQSNREQDQDSDPDRSSYEGMSPKQKIINQTAEHDRPDHQDQRVASGGLGHIR